MIVAVPADSYGNPVITGTDVEYTLTRPGGETSTDAAPTEKLLSYIDVGSRTTTGRNVVSARTGEAQGPERIFDEVAAFAVPFDIEIVGEIPVANGRDLFGISTAELFDRFGNRLPDGTIGHLELSGVTIDVGRIVEPDGAFIPDGTPAQIISDGKLYDVIVESGSVSIVVPTANDVQVTILGQTASATGRTQ